MKIDKAIFGVDDSYFLEFWPIQAKLCREILNVEPVLFYICDEDSNFYNDGHGLVKKIKKVDEVNTGLLACIARMYGTKYFPEEVCLTCDLDMLMISREYFQDQIKNLNENSLVIYSSDAYDLNRPEAKSLFETEPFPFTQEMYNYPYNAAKGKIFDQILDTNCSFEEFVRRHSNYKPGYKYMWMIDEFYFADCVNNKPHNIEVHKLKRGYTTPWIANNRIERHNFPVELEWEGERQNQEKFGIYDTIKLKEGYYYDVNCCRPYSKYKDAIDDVIEIVLERYNLNKIKMETNFEKRIEELLLTPRMFYDNFSHRHQKLNGLKMLIEDYITPSSIVLEVGSFSGVSSELFALYCNKIYCVDLWDPYWEITDKQKIEFAEYTFDKMSSNYSNITKIKKSSVEASKEFTDEHFDLIYIDAAHDYNSVKEDILTWLPKIKPGGYIAGHDYRYDPNIQVYEAVNDLFVTTKKIVSYPDSSFIIQL
jgi:predicted O-methyltransferase YrrM